METHLTLKNLAPYLPYKMYVYDTIVKKPKVMNTGQGASNNWVGIKTVLNYSNGVYKLILRPLSDFCGQRIANDSMIDLNCSYKVIEQLWKLEETGDVSCISYEAMCVLLKNHVDVFGLIPQKLAIDKNTL